ncbi:MAG: alkaline phosphatase [Coleofasciculus sp. B1-GNL1-01]|uniref:alkaline phosphatase n=1 Tax=Coleofasciculus sp. B1-GNL1-01 TaxID=3068484 RepID=UPI0032F12CD0
MVGYFTLPMSETLIRDAYFLKQIDGKEPATDSASAATAIATGQKTDAGNIAWLTGDPADGALTTIAETLRRDQGFSIGVVSTVPFSHATPAAFVSHNVNRNNYLDIANEIINTTQPDLVIGGGHPNTYGRFRYLSESDYNALNSGDAGYTFVEWTAGVDGGDALLTAAETIDVNAGEKLFGLFGGEGGNFDFHQVSDTPGNPSVTPGSVENPTLTEATNATLSVLNQDPDGFFVMFEQGDIDWSNHGNNFETMIGGVWDLDQAVQAAEAFIAQPGDDLDWSNTLMIVTSDHSNSYLRNKEVLGKGDLPQQVEASGEGSYGSPWLYPNGEVSYHTTNHTNELVTLSARGAGAASFSEYAGSWYPGTDIVDNTQIYQVMDQATQDGVEHLILFIGDGMNIEHEIASSRYLYGEDNGLAWHDWGELSDGWTGFSSTWDVTTYNKYASVHDLPAYDATNFDPTLGYDPDIGGVEPGYPEGSIIQASSDGDTLVGEVDLDDLIVASDGDDTVAGEMGHDIIVGKDGDDVLRGDRNSRSSGGQVGGDDVIYGGNGNDRIGGKGGDDILLGEDGDDQIWGDDGDDILRGGLGHDTLTGDDFSGGQGRDTFVLAAGEGTDTIVDFNVGEDFIGLVGDLTFGQLTIAQDGENTLIGLDNETLAILNQVDASNLTQDYFVAV